MAIPPRSSTPPPADEPFAAAPIAPLDYRGTPDNSDGATSTPATPPVGFSIPAFLLTAFATTIVLLILGGVVPHLAETFKDFRTELPVVTTLLLAVSSLFVRTPVWLTGPVIVLGVATAVAFIPLPRRALRLLITLILTAVVLVIALGILLPLVNLMTNISSGGSGKH